MIGRVRALSVLVSLALLGANVSPASTAAPVTVGVILATSGPFSPIGEPVRNAMELAVDDVNAHGGINGHPLKLDIVDDGGRPDTAAELATQLSGHGYPIIIGSSITPPSVGIARVASSGKFVQMYVTSTATLWDTPNGVVHNIFQMAPRNEYEVQKMLPLATKTFHTHKLAIIHDENVYGASGEAVIKAEAPKNGIVVVDDESYPTNATDTTAQLLKIKSSGADTMYLWGASPTTGLIVSQARQLGLTLQILGCGGILSDAFLKVAGRAADGLYSMSQSRFTHPNPRERAFNEAYHARFHSSPTNFAINGWNVVQVASKALAAVPDGDPAKLVSWFEHMAPYAGTMPIQFTPTDHDGGKTLVPAFAQNGVWFTT